MVWPLRIINFALWKLKKGRTNAALTLGIIGTALGAFAGNNGCGCGNNGILGGLFGGNNGNCIAEKAMQTAMAQGQMSQNLAWNNRVQSMQDDPEMKKRFEELMMNKTAK